MTVSTTLDRQYFECDGLNKNFPFDFAFFENSNIYVFTIDSDGDVTGLTEGINYTVSGAGTQSGGTVVLVSAPGLGFRLLVQRILPQVQATSFRNQGAFFPQIHETSFDRVIMLIQQALSGLDNALMLDRSGDRWDFKGKRGVNLADPINPQDAVTRNWIGNYIDTVTGNINTTNGIAYDGGTLFDYLRFGLRRQVDTVAAARLLTGTRNQVVETKGYYTKFDGGGAIYFQDTTDTTSADDGVGVLVTTDGTRLKISTSFTGEINAKQAGAKGDNSTVDRVRMQAGVDYCQAKGIKTFGIYNGTYILDSSLLIPPNITIHGNGTVKAAQTGFNGVLVAPFDGPGGAFTRPLFRNKGFFSLSISDENITVDGLTFDYGTLVLAGGGCHSINIRRARTVRVTNCTFLNGEDGTAFLGCDDTTVRGCTARNFSNCAYDHWDSPKDARVIDCYGGSSNSVQIVNFNPEPTGAESSGGYVADSFTMTGCVFEYNGASGSFCQLEPLADGNAVRHVTVTGNIFRNISVVIRRNTSNVIIANNAFVGGVATNLNPAIMCNMQAADTPTSVIVSGNHFKDWRTSAGNLGVIQMMCNGYTVTGNTVTGTLHYAAMYVGAYQGRQSGNYFFPGTSGQEIIGTGDVPAWTAIGLANGWQNSGTAGENLASYKVFSDERRVVCRGSIKLGTMGAPAFVMPGFLSPEGVTRRPVVSNGAFAFVLINTDGTVTPTNGSNTQVSLDNVEWYY